MCHITCVLEPHQLIHNESEIHFTQCSLVKTHFKMLHELFKKTNK